jgi:hypothetical protein
LNTLPPPPPPPAVVFMKEARVRNQQMNEKKMNERGQKTMMKMRESYELEVEFLVLEEDLRDLQTTTTTKSKKRCDIQSLENSLQSFEEFNSIFEMDSF